MYNCQHHHHHSIFCILPPHILRNIAERGSEVQRRAALQALSVDTTFRSMRSTALMARPATAPNRSLFAAEPLTVKQRTIHDANHQETLPGRIVRTEGQAPTGDPAVDEAYEGLGDTFDFFAEAYHRNSIDDDGMPLIATVHYGRDYNNAFFNSEQMVFGDGDGVLFNRFTIALDVIGHELGHGVTEDEAGLRYLFQSGALNESMSDVFGSMVKQKKLNQTADSADWLIGAGLLADGVNGRALRDMRAPGTAFDDPVLGKDPQPDHMDKYVLTNEDNGGVHINSSIPNRAFYLAATSIGGFAWEKAGRIWYEALRDSRVRPTTGFRRFAGITADIAGRLYGFCSQEQRAVVDAWSTVGLPPTGAALVRRSREREPAIA